MTHYRIESNRIDLKCSLFLSRSLPPFSLFRVIKMYMDDHWPMTIIDHRAIVAVTELKHNTSHALSPNHPSSIFYNVLLHFDDLFNISSFPSVMFFIFYLFLFLFVYIWIVHILWLLISNQKLTSYTINR